MFYNYLKTGWRALTRGRLYSIINLTGLSVGTAVVILLSAYIKDELSFEYFHPEHDRIYRTWVKEHYQGDVFFNTVTPFILGPQLRDHLPEIELMARYTSLRSPIRQGDYTSSDLIYMIDPDFLKMFNFPINEGNERTLMDNPSSLILTEITAQKYFDDTDPVGKNLEIQLEGEWVNFIVAGVADNPPSNTGFQFDILIPLKNADRLYTERTQNSWTNVIVETFIKLNKTQSLDHFQDKVNPFVDNQVKDIYEAGKYIVGFQPLTDIHLNREFPEGILPVSDGRYPYILAGIAFLILLLAAINFTSLAVGRSLKRSKEVGIRKTSGATQWQLMLQFWSEAIITAGVSVIIGLILAWFCLPSFNQIADKSLSLGLTFSNLIFLFILTVFIGLLSGIYPALVLSRVKPVNSLKGGYNSDQQMPKHVILRSLVGFQFILSVLLICCTLVMRQQIDFLRNTNLGFNKEQIVVLPYNKPGARLSEVISEGNQKSRLLEDQLLPDGLIREITVSNHTFGSSGWTSLGFVDQHTQKFQTFKMNGIDPSFIDMHKIQLVEGRNFEENNPADLGSVMINQAFSEQFKVSVNDNLPSPFQDFRIVAITPDFHFQSLHEKVNPLVLSMDPVEMLRTATDVSFQDFPSPKISLKLSGVDIPSALKSIESSWKAITDLPFSFSFMDENLDRLYQSEQRLGSLLFIATILAIIIACLGLFGMVTILIGHKAKEIAIRKVLGASTFHIILYFNRKFTVMIGLACLIAIPLALYLMNQWLEDFAYRINPPWWLYSIAAVAALLLAGVTISLQSLRAASTNPIQSMRSE